VPLIPPALDDRSYSDLVQDLLASIPAHTPEWTVQQPGDPGRTLIELFAWLADSILYRANLIPERQRLAFLKLLGRPVRAAAAARGIVSVFSDPSGTGAVTLPPAVKVPGPVNFETLSELDVQPVTALAFIKSKLSSQQAAGALALLTGLKTLYKMANVPSGYATTPVFAGNMADPNGVDVFGTVDHCIWLALRCSKPEQLAEVRATLGGKHGERILSLGFIPALPPSDPFADIGPAAAVPATWQISAASTGTAPPTYHSLSVAADSTRGFTRPGVVQLVLPAAEDIGAPPNDVRSDARAGVGAKPPRVDDPDFDKTLVAWIRVQVKTPLRLNWAGVNAVEIDQRTTYRSVLIGVSDGSASQQFALAQTQIEPETFQLEVFMPGLGFQLWNPTDDLSVLQGPLPSYVLDPEAGTVTFGNQMQGLIPPIGAQIRARLMRVGGGSAGNLAAATLKAIETGGSPAVHLTVQQPSATIGGADVETLDQAERRIPAILRHQERAVTAADYKDLAEETPGASIGRVEVMPLFKPQTRASNIPGVVSVMIFPRKDGVQPPCPRADRTLLEQVYAYLNPRRPVSSEMYVIGSEYIGLGVSVAVEVRNGFGLLQVSQQVELALRSYLWPTPPGGLTNEGWPLGRGVRSLELEVIVSQVPGVVEVNGLLLFRYKSNGTYEALPTDGSGQSEMTLDSWQLPELLQVTVEAGTDGSGVKPGSLTPPVETDDTVAVPVVPKVC
jgi:predicted phage baseplate assembly protein